LFDAFSPLAAIATTPTAAQTLLPLCQSGAVTLWIPEAIAPQLSLPQSTHFHTFQLPLKSHLAELWATHHGLIFGLATGAVVRLISPLLDSKATDPAVVVVDGAGKFVISLCGGHQGGADRLTRAVSLHLGATPILTGGANQLHLPGIDLIGQPWGWQRGTGDWTGVSAAIARQASVEVIQESGSRLWEKSLPANHPFQFSAVPASAEARVWISPQLRSFQADDCPQVQWHPRVLWVGIGCERNTPKTVIESAIQQVFRSHQLAEAAIAGIATIDLKADEPGLLELCGDRQLPLRCFSADRLREISVPTPSTVVAAEVGTPSVAEAAAILSSQEWSHKIEEEANTADATIPHTATDALLIPKQIVRLDGQPGAVTVAVAQAQQEYIGRTGQLWLIGTGPGDLVQITPAAQTAIAQADVVIGYSLYVDLITPLLRPGQVIEALPITQERERANRAIELAQWGLTVAVISSGDCGIYGMAGLVLEQLQTDGWDGKTPDVQVFPGITAMQAAASRVGAPLMHDFCAISLSDLLTPWEVIEKRLAAAAQADFVTAIYNPRSRTRTEQIAIAQQLFLKHRSPDTPVAIVRSVYRPDEQITLTTLAKFLTVPIDMLTVVIIGNQSTRLHEGWMITPRGYLQQ
jgi:cobalt-precorrin 5A hydrolase / precorrin-3B C17-methyltransferase